MNSIISNIEQYYGISDITDRCRRYPYTEARMVAVVLLRRSGMSHAQVALQIGRTRCYTAALWRSAVIQVERQVKGSLCIAVNDLSV
jgi:hypothetical protein